MGIYMYLINKEKINRSLSAKIVDARVAHVFNTYRDILITSSFGTTSAVLLHLVSRMRPGYPIYFIDTGYHFEETIDYKNRLTRLLDWASNCGKIILTSAARLIKMNRCSI